MKLDNMDFLRQQIEASLGRTEELILLDKTKCGVFYRYPAEAVPPSAKKRNPKERVGTFNSVRLKKYLGIGSKRKQKGNNDEVTQHPVYIGELQRYGSYYNADASQFPVYHPEYHRRKALHYDTGTVRIGRSLHYPNMYASVSVRSPHSRGSVYGVYPWPEHYFHSSSAPPTPLTNMAILTELSPISVDSSEPCACPCTCDESVIKSKRHPNKCTCTPGTRSRWWTKRMSRPSLFHGANSNELSSIEGINKLERQTSAKANQYEQSPSARSRLRRLSELSANDVETQQEAFYRASNDYQESTQNRKSILECPVNAYELISGNHESTKHQSNSIKKSPVHEYEDLDDRFVDNTERKDKSKTSSKESSNSKAKKSTPNAFRSISSGRRLRMEDDVENDAPDISLGGQRIRLFGTVNGSSSKVVKRPSLPSFADRSTLDSDLKAPLGVNRNVLSASKLNMTDRKSEVAKILDASTNFKSNYTSRGSQRDDSGDDWHIDDGDSEESRGEMENENKSHMSTLANRPLLSPKLNSRKRIQHKTKIAIGGNVRQKVERANSELKRSEEKSPSAAEPTYVNVNADVLNGNSRLHTVISVGHDAETSSRSADNNKLNLKINFNELPAYLKPILKKSPYVESSASSEAEGSETYSNSSQFGEPNRQKQKKHVHFLSSRKFSSPQLHALEDRDDDVSEKEEVDVKSEDVSNKSDSQSATEDDSDHEASSPDSESSKSGSASNSSSSGESEEESISSSASSQDLYDDGISISNEINKLVDDRVANWTPENRFHGQQKQNKADLRNVKFATSNDDMMVIGMKKSHSDAKKFNLRRSQSERQVAAENSLSYGELDENNVVDRSTRLSPVRSNSFQAVASMKSARNSFPPLEEVNCVDEDYDNTSFTNSSIPRKVVLQMKGSCTVDRSQDNNSQLSTISGLKSYLKSSSSPTALHKKNLAQDINQQTQSQPLYQNSSQHSQMVATILTKCTNNNNTASGIDCTANAKRVSPSLSPRKKFNQSCRSGCHQLGLKNDADSEQHVNFESCVDKRIRSCDVDFAAENNNKLCTTSRTNSSADLEIAKMKAIPKFLPRPSYVGKHVPVCSRYSNKEEAEQMTSGWSSEDELYADGTSQILNHSFDSHRQQAANDNYRSSNLMDRQRLSPTLKSDDSDDNGIYEQIGEPLYEEVPDTISYSSGTSGTGSMGHPRKSIFEGASKTEILNYLEDAKERGVENIPSTEEDADALPDEELENEATDELETQKSLGTKRNHRNRISNLSNLSDSSHTSEESFQNGDAKDNDTRHGHTNVEVERNDSGVGSETSKPSRLRRQSRLEEGSEQICIDCDLPIDKVWDKENGSGYVEPLVCKKCCKKRCERKEIILEFVETEIKYGRDLRIIKEEFHRPMLVAGLLSEELLSNIFLNLDQLIEVNDKFTEKLKDALDIAAENGDEDYNTVNVGKIFLDSSSMLPAFEAYCVRQGTASVLLTNLEKEKELLRIFLKVSQMENTLLRRLNLNSFLMVPVQRVTKYPLLINRLYKVTPHHHQDREALRDAQLKIELHLEHINQQAKDFSGMNLWRRISNMSNPQRRNLLEPVIGNIKMRKMALEILQWNNEEVRFVMEGRLQYTQINENLWNKKSLKLTQIHGLLVTLGNPNSDYRPDLADREYIFPRNTGIREATLVLIKEKNSRFTLIREPLPLQRCVISCDPEIEDMFEVQEFTTKEAYLLKAEDVKDTQEWSKMLRYHAKDLGAWRRRRNALANIMINGMAARREWL